MDTIVVVVDVTDDVVGGGVAGGVAVAGVGIAAGGIDAGVVCLLCVIDVAVNGGVDEMRRWMIVGGDSVVVFG